MTEPDGLMYLPQRKVLRMMFDTDMPWCLPEPYGHYFAHDAGICYCGIYVIDGFKVRLR